MPERDSVTDEAKFVEIITRETEAVLDPGIRSFDRSIDETEEYINDDGGVESPLLDDALDQLNSSWNFHKDVGTITARVYLSDPVLKDCMPDEWGEPTQDPEGQLFYLVEDTELRSFGVVKGPHDYTFDPDEHQQSKVRFAYGFSLPNDDVGFHQLVVYAGESSHHAYGTPSFEAIDLRLHRDWPEAMNLVDYLIAEGERETQRLPKRLQTLARKLQAQLRESEDLREWLGVYIDKRIAFDTRWSVALTMNGPISFIDDEGDTLALDIQDDHTEHCFTPRVAFLLTENGDDSAVYAAFISEFAHPADENYWNTAIVPVESVNALRSTRRTTSLAHLAMAAKFTRENDAHARQVEPIEHAEPEIMESSATLELQRNYQSLIDKFTAQVRKVRRRSNFSSEEQALQVADKLAQEFSLQLRTVSAHAMLLRLRGPAVAVPNITVRSDEDSSGIILELNSEQPIGAPDASQDFIGYFTGMIAATEEVEGENGDTLYLPMPKMIVNLGGTPIEMANTMVQGEVRKRAFVNMDAFGSLKVAQLEMVDDFRSSFKKFKQKHTGSSLVDLLSQFNRVENALAKDNTQPTALKDFSIFKRLIVELDKEDVAASEALIVLSKMLNLAIAKVTGDVFIDGVRVDDYELVGSIESVIDHVPDDTTTGPAFAMHVTHEPGKPVYYIPLKSVTKFMY